MHRPISDFQVQLNDLGSVNHINRASVPTLLRFDSFGQNSLELIGRIAAPRPLSLIRDMAQHKRTGGHGPQYRAETSSLHPDGRMSP
jgi:hypothetical protein